MQRGIQLSKARLATLLACACAATPAQAAVVTPTHPHAHHGAPAQLAHVSATARGGKPHATASAKSRAPEHGRTANHAESKAHGREAKQDKPTGKGTRSQPNARAAAAHPKGATGRTEAAGQRHGHSAGTRAEVRETKLVRVGKGRKARMVRVAVMSREAAAPAIRSARKPESSSNARTLAELAPNKTAYPSHPNGVLVLRGTQTPPTLAEDQAVAAETPVREETFRGRIKSLLFGPLRGSHDSLVRQNTRADADGSARIEDDDDLQEQVAKRRLVSIPEGPYLLTDTRLPENRRFTRPWTARFLRDISSAFGERWGGQLVVTSAVRTAETQAHLIKVNGNAAPVDGETASSHMRGGTIDIGKKGMTGAQINWMRSYLAPLQEAGKIDVAEEFKQACFHISVYKSYVNVGVPKQYVAQDDRPPAPTAAGGAQ